MLRASPLHVNNPAHLNLLLETLRIINHNLPLRTGEYNESKLLEALVVKQEMQTVVNAKRVKEAIVELYRSTKAEMTEYLADNREHYHIFTLVADFWTCKTTDDNFLGLRVYRIDKDWQFNSVLLGTKMFNPSYRDRDGRIRKPFKTWLNKMPKDFGLSTNDFYGSASDSGGDVKYMLSSELHLKWEWCFAHIAHAATKMSCGLNGKKSREANPDMAELISKMTWVITQVKLVSTARRPIFRSLQVKNQRFYSASGALNVSGFEHDHRNETCSCEVACYRCLSTVSSLCAADSMAYQDGMLWGELREVNNKIRSSLLSLLKSVAESLEAAEEQSVSSVARLSRLETRFAPRPVRQQPLAELTDVLKMNWIDGWRIKLGPNAIRTWHRKSPCFSFGRGSKSQASTGLSLKLLEFYSLYHLLHELERDFSVSGEMVSRQRTSLAGDNIDMCIFLNRNPEFVNLLQC
ncbi:unnamed protein product [Phytophthora fragariaefolia]|uniref:Unnamed protein product n=1 Tax=Phytophthora fragariaefolia TaxID=1490495 RepID=A0A9W6TTZ1_9STRA|nr:unnamed protein product [Phytophthora fragariaefolia]